MLKRGLILLALLAAGCGGEDDEGARRTAATPTPTAAPAQAEPQLPERPQVDLEGDDLPAFRAGRAVAPEPAPGTVSVVGTIRRPERLQGRAGVFCRGYRLTIDRGGRARVERVSDGRLVSGLRARFDAASPPGTPVPVVLTCGAGEREGEVVLGFTVGARQLTYVRDQGSLTGTRAGLVARRTADQARFAALQLYLAE